MLKKLFQRASIVAGVVVAGANVAMADSVDTAITALGTQGSSYVADALGVALIVAGGFWGISVMKKAMSAAK